ncbi:hypothetical protein [Streptomyces paradoxus]|uniref:Uncharacterized protein n=1 Tax=Streptomyces paradoxus TaxID=66375 RepID=A0A7W9WJL7_9ACTN|nr:hypothetical protein [Streptomyces paradoxus]MBB6079399.1 hypothetical protein [Streptomyces paradoxus]
MTGGTRWLLAGAGAVAMVAFTVPTVTCGMWLLPALVSDAAARWGVSSALGAAVAALSVLWGQGFATRPGGGGGTAGGPTRSVQATGTRAVAVGATVQGNISTGDGGVPGTNPPSGHTTQGTTTASPQRQAGTAPSGSVTASGERSVAVGGAVVGDITTGDRPSEGDRR